MYGSKAWADGVLRLAIAECKNFERVKSARCSEINYFIDELYLNGWVWHSKILRAWKHRYWYDLQPIKADSALADAEKTSLESLSEGLP